MSTLFVVLLITLELSRNYFDLTKLFSDLCLSKFLDTSAKSFFSCNFHESIREIRDCSHIQMEGPLSIELHSKLHSSIVHNAVTFISWADNLSCPLTRYIYYGASHDIAKFRAEAHERPKTARVNIRSLYTFILPEYHVDLLKICALCRRILYYGHTL